MVKTRFAIAIVNAFAIIHSFAIPMGNSIMTNQNHSTRNPIITGSQNDWRIYAVVNNYCLALLHGGGIDARLCNENCPATGGKIKTSRYSSRPRTIV